MNAVFKQNYKYLKINIMSKAIELYKKTQRKLLVCPDCASSEIEFKVWYDPNDRKSTAFELDDGELEDGWCHSCNDEISHCVESKKSIDETN
tara:strand:- start:1105 stop:1380 length:276 start_codon:yes stop_codon:yes gene_type:complete